MRHSGLDWTDAQKTELMLAMAQRKGSISSVAKKFAKKVGTTPGAVHAKYNSLRKSGVPANTSRVPNAATTPDYLFNGHIKRVEEITGHTFTPSEIVEMNEIIKH